MAKASDVSTTVQGWIRDGLDADAIRVGHLTENEGSAHQGGCRKLNGHLRPMGVLTEVASLTTHTCCLGEPSDLSDDDRWVPEDLDRVLSLASSASDAVETRLRVEGLLETGETSDFLEATRAAYRASGPSAYGLEEVTFANPWSPVIAAEALEIRRRLTESAPPHLPELGEFMRRRTIMELEKVFAPGVAREQVEQALAELAAPSAAGASGQVLVRTSSLVQLDVTRDADSGTVLTPLVLGMVLLMTTAVAPGWLKVDAAVWADLNPSLSDVVLDSVMLEPTDDDAVIHAARVLFKDAAGSGPFSTLKTALAGARAL